MQNEYGYTNVDSYILDKAVKSGSGSDPCTIETKYYTTINKNDTSHTCFVKAEQSGVKDWAVFYNGNCELLGAASGEYTTNNISVNCALDINKNWQNELQYTPKSANVIYVIRYNDGTSLTSPNISINADIHATTPSGFCGQIAAVNSIPTGASGIGCQNTLTLQNAIQSGKTENINQSNYRYVNGVCYKINYTGSLTCSDGNPDPFVESLGYTGNLGCVNQPVSPFLCGISETPKWKYAEVSSFDSKSNVTNDIIIPQPNNSGIAYTVNGLAISTYTDDSIPANCNGDSCTAELEVVSGNEIEAFMIEQLSNTSDCKFRNNSDTVDLSLNTWYNNTGALVYCEKQYSGNQVTEYNASMRIKYRLKDGTFIKGKTTQINYKENSNTTAKVCKNDANTYVNYQTDSGGAGQDSNWDRVYEDWIYEGVTVYSRWEDNTGSVECHSPINCSGRSETGYRFYDNPNFRHIVYDDNYQYTVENDSVCREPRQDMTVNWKQIYMFDAMPFGYYTNNVDLTDWSSASSSYNPPASCNKGEIYKYKKSVFTMNGESIYLVAYKCF